MDKTIATTIRMLSIDAVQAANSGHPGLPLGAADIATVLYSRHLKFNPKEPTWFDRDRFILSAGHGSAMLYAVLHVFGYPLSIDDLKDFLSERRAFLLRLLENPNLLEHEKFTELLWAVFHLTEELEYRGDLKSLPETDYRHIEGDIKRAYVILISEYLDYIKHLRSSYPYLFSLASRINPFNDEASPIVTQ